jgi:hypothetical protein
MKLERQADSRDELHVASNAAYYKIHVLFIFLKKYAL